MTLMSLNNKKIAVLGLGLENYWLIKYLAKHKVTGELTICDQRPEKELRAKFPDLPARLNWQTGGNYNRDLAKFDVLSRAPGWPMACPGIRQARKNKKIIITSPMQLFFDFCPSRNIIGVTGTKGKGTTASLIYHIIKASGQRVWLGGNIGTAPLSFLDKIKTADWVVLELSSFQLEDLTSSPHIAVLTNFSPEHLAPADPHNPNYHPSLKHYWRSKSNIFKYQTAKDYLIINQKKPIKTAPAKIIYFTVSQLPSRLAGAHNQENIAAAVAAAKILKIKIATIAAAVKSFHGLEHRLQLVGRWQGVAYYDDSFATTPDSALIALKSFPAPIILIAGGADKGANFNALARRIKRQVKAVALLAGAGTPALAQSLAAVGYPARQLSTFTALKPAVAWSVAQAQAGDIILLSPACASFGMFNNYKERGQLFHQAVRQLATLYTNKPVAKQLKVKK